MNDASNQNDDDDAEKMRLDFEAFMMGSNCIKTVQDETKDELLPSGQSKKKKKKKKKSSLGGGGGTKARTAVTPPQQVTPSKPGGSSGGGGIDSNTFSSPTMAKSDKKRYYQLLRSFNDKIRYTWFEYDDQLLALLQNIASIRKRLPLEWKLLQSHGQGEEGANVPEEEGWKHFGLLGKPKELPYSFHLHTSDIELTLHHDLKQHEKMLAGVRSLVSNLAECHEALGRQVDNLWKFHLDCITPEEEEEEGGVVGIGGMGGMTTVVVGEDNNMQVIVDSTSEVYRMLSMELYRKQGLVTSVLESTDDDILGIESENRKGGDSLEQTSEGGLDTARKCYRAWPRSSEESCVDDELILYVMKLGETQQQQQQ